MRALKGDTCIPHHIAPRHPSVVCPSLYVVGSTLLEKQMACSTARALSGCPTCLWDQGKGSVVSSVYTSLYSTSQLIVVTRGLSDDLPKNIIPHGIFPSSCLTLLHQAEPPASCFFLAFSTLRCPFSSSLPWSLTTAHYRLLTLCHTLVLIPTVSAYNLSAQCTHL